ncbi:hypothetical protein NMY22_g12383 [Coprinellus aureogranulatus]|nr:hypothetical protein NMY22_g12383 [Coprinellus aureogranulatus]
MIIMPPQRSSACIYTVNLLLSFALCTASESALAFLPVCGCDNKVGAYGVQAVCDRHTVLGRFGGQDRLAAHDA